MYHYVRNNILENTPCLNSLDINIFTSQLDWLLENLSPLSFEKFNYCIKTNTEFPPGSFLLTFDDGLQEHYRYVYPEIKKRNLIGFFFINTGVYTSNAPMCVHIIHFLCEKLGETKFIEILNQKLSDYDVVTENNEFTTLYQYDQKPMAELKKILNYSLDYNIRDTILNDLYLEYFPDNNQFIKKTYLSLDEMKEMQSNKMIFGAHTVSHKVLSRLTKDQQYEELSQSKQFLTKNLDLEDVLFSYPYGHRGTYNRTTLDLLHRLGFHSAFNTVRGSTSLLSSNKYELSRLDTRDVFPVNPKFKV